METIIQIKKGTKSMTKKNYSHKVKETSGSTINEPRVSYGLSAAAEQLLQSQYTLDELNARIDEAENDIDAGRVYTSEQVHDILEKKYPWLCK